MYVALCHHMIKHSGARKNHFSVTLPNCHHIRHRPQFMLASDLMPSNITQHSQHPAMLFPAVDSSAVVRLIDPALHVIPQGVAPDLTEGQEYEFRIIAVNKAGQSEPSEPSDLVMARPRRRESLSRRLFIDRRNTWKPLLLKQVSPSDVLIAKRTKA